MPTQIPVHVERSYVVEAIAALMLSLLAAAVDGVISFIIVWAYS
jgi:ABC-type enterobactin transport system permease subunit